MNTVELRVDIGGKDLIPHAFLVIVGPDGIERGYGLGPALQGNWKGAGKLYDDTHHEYSASTGTWKLLI